MPEPAFHYQTAFDPLQHGFHFANSFDLLPKIKLPKIAGHDLEALSVVGLCGGMCYTALDYFHAGWPPPTDSDPLRLPPALDHYLRKRQGNAMALGALLRLAGWVLSSDPQPARKTWQQEIPRLLERLERGQPAVLLLVRTQGTQDPTRNHQVIAAGCSRDAANHWFEITLYDPNHPGEQPSILVTINEEGQEISLAQSSGEPLRGFFVQNYRQSIPPSAG